MPDGEPNPSENAASPDAAPIPPAPTTPPPYPAPTSHSSPTGILTQSLLCNGCGYDLIGLPESGVCPECARSVQATILGNDLRYAPTAYLHSLARGALIVEAAIAVNITKMFVLLGGWFIYAYFFRGHTDDGLVQAIYWILGTTASILSAAGWWLLSAPDPSRLAGDKGETPRRLVRVTVCLVIVGTVAGIGLEVYRRFALPPPVLGTGRATGLSSLGIGMGLAEVTAQLAVGIGYLAWVVQFFASMTYLAWLAPRIPNHSAARLATTLLWLGPLLAIGLCCVFYIGPIAAQLISLVLLETIRSNITKLREGQIETPPPPSPAPSGGGVTRLGE